MGNGGGAGDSLRLAAPTDPSPGGVDTGGGASGRGRTRSAPPLRAGGGGTVAVSPKTVLPPQPRVAPPWGEAGQPPPAGRPARRVDASALVCAQHALRRDVRTCKCGDCEPPAKRGDFIALKEESVTDTTSPSLVAASGDKVTPPRDGAPPPVQAGLPPELPHPKRPRTTTKSHDQNYGASRADDHRPGRAPRSTAEGRDGPRAWGPL